MLLESLCLVALVMGVHSKLSVGFLERFQHPKKTPRNQLRSQTLAESRARRGVLPRSCIARAGPRELRTGARSSAALSPLTNLCQQHSWGGSSPPHTPRRHLRPGAPLQGWEL